MLRRYPETLRWRQALPPSFVLSLVGLIVLSVFFPFVVFVLIGELLLYFLILSLAGARSAVKKNAPFLVIGLPLAIPVMHIAWGSGFLWSILVSGSGKNG